MKFLFINSARSWGGNEKWMLTAANTLSVENRVFIAYRSTEIGQRFCLGKIRLPFWSELDVYTIIRLIFFVLKNKIDVLIPTKQKDYFLAGIVSTLLGKKNILRLGIVRELNNKAIYNIIYNKLCNGIIVNAQVIKDVLLKSNFIKPEKIKVIYNGVDRSAILRKAEAENNFNPEFPFNIVSSGELSKRKGFDFLIKAFTSFLSKNDLKINCGLILIGEGSEREKLETLCHTLKINKNVTFTGFLSNPYPIINKCDIFALTSKNEGISNAILEAMTLQKPVISSDAGGIKEIIKSGKNGFVITGEDLNELAEIILLLYNNANLRAKIGAGGLEVVKENFDLQLMTKEILDFCENI